MSHRTKCGTSFQTIVLSVELAPFLCACLSSSSSTTYKERDRQGAGFGKVEETGETV
jgi:hypothetical protein